MDLHRLAEERSLAAHRLIAERLRDDRSVLDEARGRVESWAATGAVGRPYVDEWRRILTGSLDEISAVLTDPGERARALRQATPFAGALSPRERWRLWDEVRSKMERAE